MTGQQTMGAQAAVAPAAVARSLSPNQRAWARFKRNRPGYLSLWAFVVLLLLATCAELVCNDRPFVAHIDGKWYAPVVSNPAEVALGGDFATPTDWKDPFITQLLARPGNWAFTTIVPHSATSTNYFAKLAPPAPPSALNWLGTDDKGRDMVARLLYGFRVSIWFAIALTVTGSLIGIAMGALQGYFGGRVDLVMQRLIEIWGAVPELYLLIIFAAVFDPSLVLLLVLLSLWGWMGLDGAVGLCPCRVPAQPLARIRQGCPCAGLERLADHASSRVAQFTHTGDHLPALSHEHGHPGADLARLPRPGGAGQRAVAG